MVTEAESMKEFLKMIGAKGTKEILVFLDENGKGQYMQFRQYMSSHMLNVRLKQLLEFGLIKHHVTKLERKMEWYTITEKGKKIVHYLKEMEEIIREYPNK
jgi:DNA-binding HxlR family transcriptional regulator